MIMVFEQAGRLRYHALWAYTAVVALSIGLDKIVVSDIQALAVILAPIALVITADVIKNRNKIASDKAK